MSFSQIASFESLCQRTHCQPCRCCSESLRSHLLAHACHKKGQRLKKKILASHPSICWHFQWKKLSWAWPFLYQSVCLFLFLVFVFVFSHPWTFTLPMTDIVFGTVMFGPKKWPSLRYTCGISQIISSWKSNYYRSYLTWSVLFES